MDNLHLHGKRCLEQKNAGKKLLKSKINANFCIFFHLKSNENEYRKEKETEKWVNWQGNRANND